jgi:NTE family protein
MIRGRQYSNALREAFGEQFIEELPVPFFAMAADLTDRKALAIDRGRLWKATRASSSLPGIAPPLLHSGHLLVDGGIMNNVPADVMKERGAGRVLAVHVGENDVTVNDAVLAALQRSPGEAPPVLRMLWNRMLPRSRRTYFPGLAQILLRSAMLGGESHDQVARASATVWTTLPVHEFSLLNWKAAPDLIEIGYRHAMDNMDEWKRLLLE